MEVAEAAFESATQVRVGGLPSAPLGKRSQARQVVAVGENLQPQISQGCGGFADSETWVPSAFDHQHRETEASCDHGQKRSGKPGTDDGEVEVGRHGSDGKGWVSGGQPGTSPSRKGEGLPEIKSLTLFITTPLSTFCGLPVRSGSSCLTTPRRGLRPSAHPRK